MGYAQGQTTYNIFPVQAVPGQLMDEEFNVINSFCAASNIYPGTAVELTSDGVSIQMCQDASSSASLTSLVGIALLQTAREGAGSEDLTTTNGGAVWLAGDMVQVIQRGKVWGLWSGTTQTANGVPNIKHFSATATSQGVFTDASPASTTGSEVSAGPSGIVCKFAATGTGNVIPLLVNLPGKY